MFGCLGGFRRRQNFRCCMNFRRCCNFRCCCNLRCCLYFRFCLYFRCCLYFGRCLCRNGRLGLCRGFGCNFFGGRGLHGCGLGYRLGWGIGVQRGYFDYFGDLGVGRGFGRRLLKLRRRL